MNVFSYRDGKMFQQLSEKIIPFLASSIERLGRKFRFMEVCGTHTVSFSKTGIRELLAPYVELISGPGCPVCVTDQSDMDHMIAYAREKDVIVTTFGDMMKVPGSVSTLSRERADGADVRIVYSADDAVEIAKQNCNRQVVFLGVGFETTAPGIALAIQKASRERCRNFFVYSAHKLTPPAVQTLIQDAEHQIDGFLLPGHVSVMIGRKGWMFLADKHPAVIGGFEPIDLLTSIYFLARNVISGKTDIMNLYSRFVREEGNPKALDILKKTFQIIPVQWRGFGEIDNSGLAIGSSYNSYDAARMIPIQKPKTKTAKGCRCGEIVKGKEKPFQCKLFGRACTPEKPLGPCMVSSEGACSTYYYFEKDKELVNT
ncbi:hydrogenase formation protein HypD [Brevibacillus sp. LEMMJ03]|uniref:hydrogenase formation protein HypD n=1 Tax=Brevibacillus sp. LEMMJ03 TaxID=2595056 RepID=UPI0009E34534|nr:hydrogenase formation protein HypD [Brevibacillus sp. LEMMJ03]TRY24962.1 hydrogenase formation protein HypD [Brevibacillus sp. LEMMJ03]